MSSWMCVQPVCVCTAVCVWKVCASYVIEQRAAVATSESVAKEVALEQLGIVVSASGANEANEGHRPVTTRSPTCQLSRLLTRAFASSHPQCAWRGNWPF